MSVLETTPARTEDHTPVVAVVTTDEVVRRRVVTALEDDGQVVTSADEVASGAVDAVVLGAHGGAEERAAAIRDAKTRLPDADVVVIATADSNGVHKAFEAGAAGFVFESNLEVTLGPTVRAVCAGQVVVPPVMRSSVVRPALTHREKQTLGLAVLGLTNAEIARHLYLAESTVKCHMTSIFSKLGVRSRSEATAHVLDPSYGLGLGILKLSGNGEPAELVE